MLRDHHWRPLNILHQNIYCLWKRIGCWFPHVSELSPHMQARGFDGHWIHHWEFRDCLPLIFSHNSRLPIVQQGLRPGERVVYVNMSSDVPRRCTLFQLRPHMADSSDMLGKYARILCVVTENMTSVREVWNMLEENRENYLKCKSQVVLTHSQ